MLDLSFPVVTVQHASVHTPIEGPHLKLTREQRLFVALLEVNVVPPNNDLPMREMREIQHYLEL